VIDGCVLFQLQIHSIAEEVVVVEEEDEDEEEEERRQAVDS